MSPEDYLAWERQQPEKHEYLRGAVFAMAGATREHNLVVGNVVTRLTLALADRPCETYPSDMRVHVPATGLYTYPDASVVCGDVELDTRELDTLRNPGVLVEVLSPSTEAYDRGEKFEQYRTIPSLSDYLLVSSTRVLVEHFARQPDASWVLREHRAGGRVRLSIGVELAVDELYLKVFPAPAASGA
jgi:Uma2 family endonuclease